MKNDLENKNSHKPPTFNQFLRWAKDPASSLVDFFVKISKIRQFLESCKKIASESLPKRSDKKKVRRVEEDEMNVSMLSPEAPADNLECSDSFATGDFRLPTVLGKIQRRKKKGGK